MAQYSIAGAEGCGGERAAPKRRCAWPRDPLRRKRVGIFHFAIDSPPIFAYKRLAQANPSFRERIFSSCKKLRCRLDCRVAAGLPPLRGWAFHRWRSSVFVFRLHGLRTEECLALRRAG